MYKIAVGAFLFHNDSVLLIRKLNGKSWIPPGGHVEDDELLGDALMREVQEEVGLVPRFVMTPKIPTEGWLYQPLPFAMWDMPSKYGGRATLLHFAGIVDDISSLRLQEDEIREYKWFPVASVANNEDILLAVRMRIARAYAFIKERKFS